MRQNASKFRAENARYRLKPYASTSPKTHSPNLRGCCFEVAPQCAALPGVSITAWNGSSGSAPAWARGSEAPH